ncbi:hypothetical protein BDR06DRAFT_977720 [Suillus hirtellus]|nr:hypothetical protein BDR06DRAFT_977720 [Suillus hirtellus]
MSSMRSAQPGLLQRIVDELSVWWRVLARKTDGQEHVWVTIHDSEPKVGPAPPWPDERMGKMLPDRTLEGHDWSISSDYWDSSRPYRVCIPVDLEEHDRFPEGKWASAPFNLGRVWGVSDASGWKLSPTVHRTRTGECALLWHLLSALRSHHGIRQDRTVALAHPPQEATDYAFMMSIRHSTTHAFAPRNGKECEASPKRPAGPVQKKPAKYYAVESIGEEDKGRHISKNEYKRLTEWCHGVHKSLPGGDIFYAYENDAEDDDDAKPAGPVVSAKSLAAWEAKMAALPREEPLTSTDNVNVPAVATQGVVTAESESEASMAVVTQGIMTAESEASLVEVTQGITTQGAVNKEPAQVTVTAPIAEAIEVSVAPVPDSGTEPHEEGEAPFIPGSPIAPWIPQDSHVSTAPPSPRANSCPSSPTDARVVPPASMDGFTQKSPRLSSPQSMTRPSSSFVSGVVLSEPAGVLTTPAAVDAGRSQQQVYDRLGRPFKGESRRDAGSSQHYERRTSRPYREEGYHSHGDRTQAQAHSRYRPAYDEGYSLHGPSSNWPSSAPRCPPSPCRKERLAFPSNRSYRKRKLSSSQLELRGRTGESKRFCPEDREARRPTLSDRIVDDVRMGPSPSSSRSLIDRVHTVAKVPDTEQKPKTKQVPNPHAEQVPTLMLRPSMSQVFLQPQGLMSAAEGIWLITHAYHANELWINGPQVFMQGITFPTAPTLHSGHLITTFWSAIHVAHDLLANPNASPADSIPV